MELVLTKQALRRLRDLPPKAREALLERLKSIAADPYATHANVTALKGEKDAFPLRQAGWRALYRVDREAQEVHVAAIEPRGRAYL